MSQTKDKRRHLDQISEALEKIHKMGGTVIQGKCHYIKRDWDAEHQINGMVGMYAKNIADHYHQLLECDHVGSLFELFGGDVPAAIVGAGPSLDKNVDHLKNFPGIIIACDRAAIPLTARGIIPDLVVSVDPRRFIIAEMLDYPESVSQTLVASVCSSPEIFDKWKGKILLSRDRHPGTQFFDRILPALFPDMLGLHCVGNVGNTALQLAGAIGCGTAVLVGQDYGYTGGRMSADEFKLTKNKSASGKTLEVWTRIYRKKKDFIEAMEHRSGKLKVNGVWTYAAYPSYVKAMDEVIRAYKMDVINSTEGGIISHLPRQSLKCTVSKLQSLENKKNRAKGWARHRLAEALGGKR